MVTGVPDLATQLRAQTTTVYSGNGSVSRPRRPSEHSHDSLKGFLGCPVGYTRGASHNTQHSDIVGIADDCCVALPLQHLICQRHGNDISHVS